MAGCGVKGFCEFFQDDNGLGSMNRLATFIAIIALTITLFAVLFLASSKSGNDLREYLSALTTLGIIIAGLGGFNYAAGRVTGAYTDVRMAQAEKGLPKPAPLPTGPTTTIQVNAAEKLEKRGKR